MAAAAAATVATTKACAVQVATPEIRWHCGPTGLNEAVLSLDFLHDRAAPDAAAASIVILATGGADKEIKLWRVVPDVKENDGLEFIFSLSGHDRSVNCVRFSPDGQYLASASDDSTIIVWTKPKTAADDWSWNTITSFSDISRTLLACGHKGDITDLSWSPDSVHLSSASVDNCSVVWNVEKGEVVERRKDHTQYVQGVAWDPLGEFLVTEGNDRTCRVYALTGFDAVSRQHNTKKQIRKCTNMATIKTREFSQNAVPLTAAVDQQAKSEDATAQDPNKSKADGPALDGGASKGPPKHRMFLDDTCPVFARRLTWTPCGSYVLAPTGVFRSNEDAAAVNTVYAFARGNMSKPALHLPGQEKASLGVRCSPLLYQLRDSKGTSNNFFQTPHRSIFAVITLDAVIVYDSQQRHPVCTIKNLHYADLTDATWSADGLLLSVSSMDGYISFVRFDHGFFGQSVPHHELMRMNQEKFQAMFTTIKITKKKAKAQAAALMATTTTSEDPDATSTGSSGAAKSPAAMAVKKKPVLVSPILQAFQKRDAASAGLGSDASKPIDVSATTDVSPPVLTGVNTLQVRKKRKIAPTLVASTSTSTTATTATATATAQEATATTNDELIDLTNGQQTVVAKQTPPQPSLEEKEAEPSVEPVEIVVG